MGAILKEIGLDATLQNERLEAIAAQQQKPELPVFFVVPTAYWRKQARVKNQHISTHTFEGFARTLLALAQKRYEEISQADGLLLTMNALMRAEVAEDARAARTISETYRQLKRLGIPREQLPASLQSFSASFTLMEEMEAKRVVPLLTNDDLLPAATSALKEGMMPQVGHVYLEGFVDLTTPELALLDALKESGVYCLPESEGSSYLLESGFEKRALREHAEHRATEQRLTQATTEDEEWRGVIDGILTKINEGNNAERIGVLVATKQRVASFIERLEREGIRVADVSSTRMQESGIFVWLTSRLSTPFLDQEARLLLTDQLFQIAGVSGKTYVKAKQRLIQTGKSGIEALDSLVEAAGEQEAAREESLGKRIARLRCLLDSLLDSEIWPHDDEFSPRAQEKIAGQLLREKLTSEEARVKKLSLGEQTVSLDVFLQWLQAMFGSLSLSDASEEGVQLLTWSDVGAFSGEALFVVGLNAAVFPQSYSFQGYVTEHDLKNMPLPGLPTKESVRRAQKLQYQLLPFVCDFLHISYICGVDQETPLQASPFLDGVALSEIWSFAGRMEREGISRSNERDKEAYVARHQDSSGDKWLDLYKRRLKRLDSGEEPLSKAQSDALKERQHASVTELEAYARCPFRYGLERVLEVREPAKEEEDLSPLLIGTLVHDLIEWLYKEIGAVGLPFAELSNETKDKVPDMLLEEWERRFQEEIEPLTPSLNRVELERTKERWSKRLLEWWDAERLRFWDNPNLREAMIQGLEVPVSTTISLHEGRSLFLVGKLDRVDTYAGELTLYDYKTGRAGIRMQEVEQGLKLQLPLYSYMVREAEGKAIAGTSYISLLEAKKRAGNGIWRDEHVGKGSAYGVSSHCQNREDELGEEAFMEKWQLHERIKTLWNGMTTKFPVAPLDCRDSCPHASICRVTEKMKGVGADEI
ncbi:PD-(D/E)XK nuclease family protein [Shouchella shacheensis]|uniref:PD-(D/E)XK nuclease family protein n=1 Tax=Shouchella shacheensis TaxID=1649580 RepID=UPI00073FC327|nr:PD-(D/E)XK nuclease family protein [Shouchella shacheensis]